MIYLILGVLLLGVFLYIYQTNAKVKFKRAQSLIDRNRFEDAQNILKSIFNKHEEAITLSALCDLTEARQLLISDPIQSSKLLLDGLRLKDLIQNSVGNEQSYEIIQRDIVNELVAISESFYRSYNYDAAISTILYVKDLAPTAFEKYAKYKYDFAVSIKDSNTFKSIRLFQDVLSAKRIFVSSTEPTSYQLFLSNSVSELFNIAQSYITQKKCSLFKTADEILKGIEYLHKESITALAELKYLEAEELLSQNQNIECKIKLEEALLLKLSIVDISNRESFALTENKVYDKQYQLSLIFLKLKDFDPAIGILKSLINVNPLAVGKLAESYLLKGKEQFNSNLYNAYDNYNDGLECRKLLNDIANLETFISVEKNIFNALFELACQFIKEKKYEKGNLILTSLYTYHSKAIDEHIKSFYLEALDNIKTNPKESISLLDSAVLKGVFLTTTLADNCYLPIEKNIIEAYVSACDSLVIKGDFHLSFNTLYKLFDKHPEALPKFINYKSIQAKNKIVDDISKSKILLDEALKSKSFSTNTTNIVSLNEALGQVYDTYILVAKSHIDKMDVNKALSILLKIETLHKSSSSLIMECHLVEGMSFLNTPERAEKCLQLALSKTADFPPIADKDELSVIGKRVNSSLLLVAKEYAKKGKYINSYTILSSLFKLESEAVTQYAESKYQEACSYSDKDTIRTIDLLFESIQCEELLTKESNKHYFALVVEKAKFKIAEIRFDEYSKTDIRVEKLNERIEKILENYNFIKAISIIRLGKEINQLGLLHFESLQNLYLNLAYKFESEGKLVKAKENYTKSLTFSQNKDSSYYCAFIRNQICNLKNGIKIRELVVKEICDIKHSFKEDFIYRYVITLLKEDKVNKAEKLIDSYLNATHEAVQKLKRICHKQKIEIAQKELEIFNDVIIGIAENTLSLNDSMEIYNSLEDKADNLSIYFPHVKQSVLDLKPLLFNNLLSLLFSEHYYDDAIKLIIKRFPRFYENHALLRNVGIACIGIAENGLISEDNFKQVVSLWLTCIHNDYLILSTLEYTTWDDNYNFTLNGSIGSNYELHNNLPDNVNYGDAETSNISIGEVQRELVKEFELQLDKIKNSTLQKKVSDFYESEINAIRKCVEIIMNDILFCTPYFAEVYNLSSVITNELIADYEQYGTEDALKIGLLYDIKKQSNLIREYGDAIQDSDAIFIAIGKLDRVQLKTSLNPSKVNRILKYETIGSGFEDKIYISIHTHILADSLNETVIPILEHIIEICPNYLNIKILYTKFINSLCVDKVNSNKMVVERALELTLKAYLLLPNDTQLQSNLYTLVRMVMREIVNNNNSSGQIVLTNALNRLKNENSFISEMIENIQNMDPKSPRIISMIDKLITLNSSYLLKEQKADVLQTQIIIRVNSSIISNSQALRDMRDVYVQYPNRNKICENFCAIILACLMETIDAPGSSASIFSLIDTVITNRSNTFKSNAVVFSDQRRNILSRLPSDQRFLFLGGYSPTQSLNDHGLKIKKVLDYLNNLSQ